MPTQKPKYKCKHCGQVVFRDSDKQWVKSYCCMADKTVHLLRVTPTTQRRADSGRQRLRG